MNESSLVFVMVSKLNLIVLTKKTLINFATECVSDLDKQKAMIIFESILTTFESSIVFLRQLGQ